MRTSRCRVLPLVIIAALALVPSISYAQSFEAVSRGSGSAVVNGGTPTQFFSWDDGDFLGSTSGTGNGTASASGSFGAAAQSSATATAELGRLSASVHTSAQFGASSDLTVQHLTSGNATISATFTDVLTVTSSSLAPGTPTQLNMTLGLAGSLLVSPITGNTNNTGHVETSFDAVGTGANPGSVSLHFVYDDLAPSSVQQTVSLSTFVGDTIRLNGLLVVSGNSIGTFTYDMPLSVTADYGHTALFSVDSPVPNVSYVSASGTAYQTVVAATEPGSVPLFALGLAMAAGMIGFHSRRHRAATLASLCLIVFAIPSARAQEKAGPAINPATGTLFLSGVRRVVSVATGNAMDMPVSGGSTYRAKNGETVLWLVPSLSAPIELTIVNSQLQPVTTVLRERGNVDITPPVLSPDGATVAYVNYLAGGTRILSRSGRPIATVAGMRPTDWTPDGRLILVGFPARDTGVYITSPDFRSVTRLNSATALWASCSPDGQKIAYEVDRTVYVMSINGGNPLTLTSGVPAEKPVWSPDGKWLAVQSLYADTTPFGDHRAVFLLRPDVEMQQKLTLLKQANGSAIETDRAMQWR